jgi:hypothetical protein
LKSCLDVKFHATASLRALRFQASHRILTGSATLGQSKRVVAPDDSRTIYMERDFAPDECAQRAATLPGAGSSSGNFARVRNHSARFIRKPDEGAARISVVSRCR